MRPSIWFSAVPSSAASVPETPSGTRCERSPAAMPLAVAVMRLIGRTPRRTTQNVTSARIATIAPVAASSTRTSRGDRVVDVLALRRDDERGRRRCRAAARARGSACRCRCRRRRTRAHRARARRRASIGMSGQRRRVTGRVRQAVEDGHAVVVVVRDEERAERSGVDLLPFSVCGPSSLGGPGPRSVRTARWCWPSPPAGRRAGATRYDSVVRVIAIAASTSTIPTTAIATIRRARSDISGRRFAQRVARRREWCAAGADRRCRPCAGGSRCRSRRRPPSPPKSYCQTWSRICAFDTTLPLLIKQVAQQLVLGRRQRHVLARRAARGARRRPSRDRRTTSPPPTARGRRAAAPR